METVSRLHVLLPKKIFFKVIESQKSDKAESEMWELIEWTFSYQFDGDLIKVGLNAASI